MEKKMENEMETGIIMGIKGVIVFQGRQGRAGEGRAKKAGPGILEGTTRYDNQTLLASIHLVSCGMAGSLVANLLLTF